MIYTHTCHGTCSRKIEVELDGDIIQSVKFYGGCDGNQKGICALVAGRNVDEVIADLQGIRCGFKMTSCPDQLSVALSEAKEAEEA